MIDLIEGILGMIFVLVMLTLYLAFIGGMMLLILKFASEWFSDERGDKE